MGQLSQIVRVALRSLRRSPAFTVTAVLTLAIGIGATTAIFTVLDAVLIRSLPYRDADRLVGIWYAITGLGVSRAPQSLGTYFTNRRLARSFEDIAVYDIASVNLGDARGALRPERLQGAHTTAGLFPLLRTPLELGRGFNEADDKPNAPPVVIISDALWKRRFAGASDIVGRSIVVDGLLRTVIGVTPPAFHFPSDRTEIYVPFALDPASFAAPFGLLGIGRLRDGVSMATAQRELTALIPRVIESYPEISPGSSMANFFRDARGTGLVRAMRDDVVGATGSLLWVAAAASGLLLLIACANVVSLLLTRADSRRRELAVRIAMGAGRLQALSTFVTEAALLSAVGGAVGLLLASFGIRALVGGSPSQIPRLAEVRIDGAAIAFTALTICAVALLCCLASAFDLRPAQITAALREGGRGATVGPARQRVRRSLVITQVAFATMLIGAATLLVRSFEGLRQVRPGFDTDHTLVLWLSAPQPTYPKDSTVLLLARRLVEAVGAVSAVTSVGISSHVPLNLPGRMYTTVANGDVSPNDVTVPPLHQLTVATGGYFPAMGIPIVVGRTFDPIGRQRPLEAIIDRSLAVQFWNDSTGARALGRRVRPVQSGGPTYTVVGVVGDVRDTSLSGPAGGILYLPTAVAADTNLDAVSRTFAVVVHVAPRVDPLAMIRPVEQAIQGVDATLPPFGVSVMKDVVRQSTARLSFIMFLLAVTAAAALLLAAVGLYGVVAYAVSLETKAIGVRLALGAQPSTVAGQVTRQGAALAVAGTAIGTVSFVIGARFLRTLLYGVSGGRDPLTILFVAAALIATGIAASWLPARRAAQIDPVKALVVD